MEIKNIIKLAIPILLLLFSSCYTENRHTVIIPDKLFSEEEMISIMTDVQLLEGALNYNRVIKRWNKELKQPYYNEVFLEYNITAKDFKQNLDYYNSDPKNMERIFEKVIENINQELGIVEIKIAEERVSDSLQKIELFNDSIRVADSLNNLQIITDSLKAINPLSTNN